MNRARILAVASIVALLGAAPGASTPAADQANIALSTAVLDRVGDSLWPGWSRAPFAIDLLTARGPIEINFASPVPAPSFPPNLEATFPWDNGVPTIVIGEPQFTQAKTPIRWSVTLLHEHFHQWQDAWPAYFTSVKGLGLAPAGQRDSMWMLNYPFPYGDPTVDRLYATMASRLADAVDSRGTPQFAAAARAYLDARASFQHDLAPKDYKYFAFQCWQEGTARYTEISVARLAAEEHARDPHFLDDAQARGLSNDAASTLGKVLKRLQTTPLQSGERSNFYAIGAGEALLLDQLHPGWRAQYLDPRMDLSVFFRTQANGARKQDSIG